MLKSRGSEKNLIDALLHDARLWGRLSGLLEDQAVVLITSFRVKNWKLLYEEEDPEKFDELQKKVNKFAEETRGKLKNLTATSQELIQLVR